MALSTAQALAKLQKQMAELEQQQQELLNAGKTEAKQAIDDILEKYGYSLVDLYPELKKGFKGVRKKTKVVIGGNTYEISGKITKEIQQALRDDGKDPADYNKQKVIDEFKKA